MKEPDFAARQAVNYLVSFCVLNSKKLEVSSEGKFSIYVYKHMGNTRSRAEYETPQIIHVWVQPAVSSMVLAL